MKAILIPFTCAMLLACGNEAPKAQLAPLPAASAAIPAALFVAADIPGPKPIAEIKKTAKAGDTVVIRGRVGGKETPFVDGAAVVSLVDVATVISCGAMPPPHIRWDYCCTPEDELVASLATLKVADASGNPLMVSLKGSHGLAEFDLLTVKGKVLSVDGQNLIIAPEAIYDAGYDGDGKKGGTPVRPVD